MFACVYAAEASRPDVLLAVARDFSPRIETCSPREVTLDLGGLERLFGDAKTIAGELRRTAADRGLRVRIAITGTRTAARLLARDRAGITIVEPGDEAAALADLRVELLEIFRAPEPRTVEPSNVPSPESRVPNPFTITLKRWGLRTLGDLAALPPDDVAARLGQDGVDWQRLARGEDSRPLVPSVPEERFEQALDLEWPIEGLEPLSFVLARLMEPLSAHLERRDRGAAVLHVRLHLVKRDGVTREVHARSLQLPAPVRDPRTLRTLALLDLESHPPSAAIDRVVVAVDPTPGRVAAAAVARAAFDADGAAHRVDGRRQLRLRGDRRFVGAGGVRNAGIRSGTRDSRLRSSSFGGRAGLGTRSSANPESRIPNPENGHPPLPCPRACARQGGCGNAGSRQHRSSWAQWRQGREVRRPVADIRRLVDAPPAHQAHPAQLGP